MQHDQKQLHQIAQDYPWYLFTIEQIAILCNVSRDVVTKARLADDSPFFLNKCRPEWFTEWMRKHPEFQLTKGTGSEIAESCATSPCPRCGNSRTLNRLREKRVRLTAVSRR
jgi:hypothetical protein